MEGRHQFLAFDCGATSGRAILAAFDGGSFGMEEVYRFPNSFIEVGGKYYWDVYAIYGHFCKCLADLGRQGVRVDSIGIDTWGGGFRLRGRGRHPSGSAQGVPRPLYRRDSRGGLRDHTA